MYGDTFFRDWDAAVFFVVMGFLASFGRLCFTILNLTLLFQ